MSVPVLRFKDDNGRDFPDWKAETIGSVLVIGSGKDYKHLSSGDIPVYGTGGYMLSVNDYLYDGESVCIGRKGTIDRPTLLNGKFWTVDTLFYTHSFKNCLPKFIYATFQRIDWKNFNEASGVPSLSKSTIEKIEIHLPLVDEQIKIANFLTALDEKITKLTQKHDLLIQYKKGVMQQIFSQELRFKDDDGEDFPEWDNTTLEEVSINYYQGINTAADKVEYVDDGVPIIQAKHITGEYLDFSDARDLSQFDYDKYKEKYNPKVNDLLISNIGTLGKVVLVESEINFLIAWNIFKVTLNTKKCYPQFIRDFLKKIASDGYFDSIKTGNATKFINKSDMLAIEIIFPCIEEQTKIANFLTAIGDKITATQTQLQAVKQYKRGLLQQMFV